MNWQQWTLILTLILQLAWDMGAHLNDKRSHIAMLIAVPIYGLLIYCAITVR